MDIVSFLSEKIHSFLNTIPSSWIDGVISSILFTLLIAFISFVLKRLNVFSTTFSKKNLIFRKQNYIHNHFTYTRPDKDYEKSLQTTDTEKEKLDPEQFFLETIIENVEDNKTIYFVIADTGIGKTSFLTNLFCRYTNYDKPLKKFFNRFKPKKRSMALITYKELVKSKQESFFKKFKKKKKAILLVDALDEYEYKKHNSKLKGLFWEDFKENYENVKEDYFSDFDKVIITVRKQFFDSYISNEVLENEKKIELSYFTNSQREQYIKYKYKYNYDIKRLVEDFDKENLSFANIPLILNFIDDIVKARLEGSLKNINEYNIYKAIVKKWIQREKDEGKVKDGLKLQKFCQKLACKIAKNYNQNNYYISEKDFIKELFNEQSLGERSLLTKEENNFKFIHEAFFEFFLAEEELMQYNSDYNYKTSEEIDFNQEHLSMAQRFFITARWDMIKPNAPKTPVNDVHGYKIPTLEILKEWYAFFDSFTNNGSLKNVFKEKGMNIICDYDKTGYEEAFKNLKDLFILNEAFFVINENEENIGINNFWDYENKKPYRETQTLIYILKDFIKALCLDALPDIDEAEHLKCFEGIKTLVHLIIRESGITGKCLKYFENSKNTLEQLSLHTNQISDEYLKPFEGASKLKTLWLNNNQITGVGLKYFENSKHTLEWLNLHTNQISDEYLKPFEGASKLKKLWLGENKITGVGLKYFENSKHTLEELTLHTNQISDEYLKPFEGASKLKTLRLDNNQITGKGLKYFENSKHTLKELSLLSNQISDEYLKPFEGASKLKKLRLSQTKITGECLEYFKNSKDVLEDLGVADNPIHPDYVFEIDDFTSLKELFIDRKILPEDHSVYQSLKNRGVNIKYYNNGDDDENNEINYVYSIV
ncbi:MAG: hypothetical protein WCY89_10820 [Flavobacteriaceae bacterium]